MMGLLLLASKLLVPSFWPPLDLVRHACTDSNLDGQPSGEGVSLPYDPGNASTENKSSDYNFLKSNLITKPI